MPEADEWQVSERHSPAPATSRLTSRSSIRVLQLMQLIIVEVNMVREITLRQAGGSVTATLPKDIADRLNVRAGDRMYVVETDQGVLLTPYDPSFEEALEAFDEVRRDYRNTLRKLAE